MEGKTRSRERSGMSGLAEVSRLHNQHSVELDDPSTDYSSVLSGDHSSVVSGGDDSNLSKSSTVSSLCSAQDLDEGCRDVRRRCVKKSATTTVLNSSHHHHHVSFDCDSTPDMSDNEASAESSAAALATTLTTMKERKKGDKEGDKDKEKEGKEGKKRRFGKKMLPRPLRRSQSAGCAKDVPAHALFLQHSLGDRGIDTVRLLWPLCWRASLSLSVGLCSCRRFSVTWAVCLLRFSVCRSVHVLGGASL